MPYKNKETRVLKQEKYRLNNREIIKRRKRDEILKLRILAVYIYSDGMMMCSECGNSEFTHLIIDHINGGGTKHRKRVKSANCAMVRLLRQQSYPPGYRILCHNCNFLSHMRSFKATHQVMFKHRLNLKLAALSAYSYGVVRCAICNISDPRILTLDHIDGGGREELKGLSLKGGADYYRWLKVNGFPDKKLRVLCLNHNCSIRMVKPTLEFIQKTLDESMLAVDGSA